MPFAMKLRIDPLPTELGYLLPPGHRGSIKSQSQNLCEALIVQKLERRIAVKCEHELHAAVAVVFATYGVGLGLSPQLQVIEFFKQKIDC